MEVIALWPSTLPPTAFLPRTQMAGWDVSSHLLTFRMEAICYSWQSIIKKEASSQTSRDQESFLFNAHVDFSL